MFEIGRIVIKTAGRDAGNTAVVVDNIDGKFSPKDLEIILIGRSEETQKQLERELECQITP